MVITFRDALTCRRLSNTELRVFYLDVEMSFVTSMILFLINVASFFSESESQPVFTKQPPSTSYVVEGNGLFLQWNYTLGGTFRLAEFDLATVPPVDIADRFKSDAVTFVHTDYQSRVEANIASTQTNVTFLSLTRVDTGDYVFKVELDDRKKNTSSIKITVQYPPEFDGNIGDAVVVEGTDPSDITLECNAAGEPPPNITWTKVYDNGSDSGVLATGNQFVLANNRTNSGTYRCTAYNGIGTAPNQTVKVDVNFKPEIVKLLVNDSTVCEGDVISVTCSAHSRPAVHTYQLFENEIPVVDGNSSAGVEILKSNLKEGNFSYRCVANNTIGTTEETVNITVKVPSKVYSLENITLIEGENRTLTCNASGSPVLTVTWTRVSTGSQSNGYLTNISRNDAGEYKCEAKNDCGHSSGSTFLTVLFKPENFKFTVSKSTVCQGTVVTFNCSAHGNPQVDTYQLLENDTPVSDGSNSLGMWSRNMSSGGVFIYKCMANNSAGTAYSMSLNVTVNVPSSIQVIQDQNVTEGNNLTLTCNASGIPPPMVSWIKADGQRSDGNVLELLNISRNQNGIYRCEASNDCGNATETTSIDVQYKPENVQLMSSAMNNKACRGEVISFNCSADANPEVTSYQLFENETAILNTSSAGMWSKTLENEGVFVYKCVANNMLGSMYSTNVMLTVNVHSSIQEIVDQNVTEGKNVTLTCNVSGIPPPMVSWMAPYGQRTVGNVLVVTNISRSQAGEYKCEASNDCGNATETATINVQYKPNNVQLMSSSMNNKACKGEVISFNCSADANPAVIYQLFENETAILNASAAGMWSKTLENEGVFVYKCVAENSLGSESSMNVAVTVDVPSSINQITQHQSVTEGDNVTLMCNASGVPPPMVSWMTPNDERVDGYKLEVKNVSRSQAGEYKCEVSNDCGNATNVTRIDVRFKPENVQLMSSAMNNAACKGKVISFNCSADAHPAVTSYQLFENEIAIFNTSATGMWSKSLENEGEFVYKCVADNSLGSEYSMNVTVTVNVPSSIIQITQHQNVTEGDNVTLTCNVSGVPSPTVYWTKPNGERISEYKLEVKNISRSEAGKYKCEASNECGNATKMTSIDVHYKPENVQFTSSAMDNKACKGAMISFNCSADAKPSVTSYQLFENNATILDINPLGIWERNVSTSGVFTYKCVANNSLGSEVSSYVMVTVNVPSTIETIRDQNVTEGETVNLTCTASGMPQPNVFWIKPKGESVPGNVLELVNITRNEFGEYTCEASNECGNATEMANIDVHYKPENVQLTTSLMNSKACQGDTITFNCSADAKPAVTSYQLYKNDTVMNASLSGMWRETLESGGVFVYKCMANNAVGSAYSTDVTFTVNAPSSIQPMHSKNVTEGDNVTLMCNVSGMPSPTVSWMTPNDQRRSEYMLELVNISRNEAGEYKCEASNECGNATEIATIDVQYPSRITNISGEQIVNKGEVVSLFCMVEGNPAPTTTWTKVADSSPVDFPLTISGSQDEGLYRCTAENGVGSSVTSDVSITVHFPASIVAIGNRTVGKGETIVLYCNVSGTPPPTVLWTHVKSGKTWNQKEWTIKGIQVGNLGEYRCNASNKYGGDIKSTLILYKGGFCEEPCPTRQSCRKFGETYVCSCPDGEKGPDCKEKEEPKKTFEVGLKIKREFKQVYEDLENPETKSLVEEIKENMMVEFKGTGLSSVKVLKLRSGSILADLVLTFNKSVGQSSVNALLTQAREDGKLGNMEVEDAVVGRTFPDTSEKDCGTFFEGDDCEKAKASLIVLCVVGGVAFLAAIVAIIAYGLHRKKSDVGSFSNGNYERADPDGTAGSAVRTYPGNGYGSVNQGYQYDGTNGQSHEMVTFRGTAPNPAQTPGITINDSSMTKKAQPGEGLYADLGEFHQKAPAPPTTPVKMPPEYERTEYAEITQFLRAPVKTDDEKENDEKEDESNVEKNSSPDEGEDPSPNMDEDPSPDMGEDPSPDMGEDPSPDMGDAGNRNSSGPVGFVVSI